MEGDVGLEDGFALCPPTLVEIVERGKGVFRGSERSQAGAVAVEVIGDRKIASIASPMNFRTSPPWRWTAATMQAK